MLPLAFNSEVQKSIRTKYQYVISVLPIGLMFASFIPLIFFALWLQEALGLRHGSLIKGNLNFWIWAGVFAGALVVSFVAGYLLGWIANALLARYLLRWPASRVIAVYWRSDVPRHWLKDDA